MGWLLLLAALVYGGGVWYAMTKAEYVGNPWYWPVYLVKNLIKKNETEE
jgi:hypothetical protein